jgi:hypothetical protein
VLIGWRVCLTVFDNPSKSMVMIVGLCFCVCDVCVVVVLRYVVIVMLRFGYVWSALRVCM